MVKEGGKPLRNVLLFVLELRKSLLVVFDFERFGSTAASGTSGASLVFPRVARCRLERGSIDRWNSCSFRFAFCVRCSSSRLNRNIVGFSTTTTTGSTSTSTTTTIIRNENLGSQKCRWLVFFLGRRWITMDDGLVDIIAIRNSLPLFVAAGRRFLFFRDFHAYLSIECMGGTGLKSHHWLIKYSENRNRNLRLSKQQ